MSSRSWPSTLVTAVVVSLAWSGPVVAGQSSRAKPPATVLAAMPPGDRAARASASLPEAEPGEYRIGVEDVLEVLVWKTPELTRTVAVRPDGRISLPLVNDISVVNLTPMQVRQLLTESYKAYLTEAEISVIVTEIHSFKVSVLGQVNLPGRYELKSRATVLDALAMAGGLAQFAKRDQIAIYRPDESGWRTYGFDYNQIVSDRQIGQNFTLAPGDIILVP